jgi:hypothetical protein
LKHTPLPVLAFTRYPNTTNARCAENLNKQTLENIFYTECVYNMLFVVALPGGHTFTKLAFVLSQQASTFLVHGI